MSSDTLAFKDPDAEHPVPTVWRNTLASIVDRFVQGDFTLASGVPCVDGIDPKTAASISGNIAAYGEPLVRLPDAAWETSVSSWQDGYWDVLVDLFTTSGASDLVLNVRIREGAGGPEAYRFDVHLVYVP